MEILDPQTVLDRLGVAASVGSDTTVQAAYSGGVDSTVLLHLLSRASGLVRFRLIALHVNHGIDSQSNDWEEHCSRFCRDEKIEFRSVALELGNQSAKVSEEVARSARYAWFSSQLDAGEMLVTAHHQNDQAETFLLNLMRGAGVRGLSAIQPLQKFGSGWLIRPLLTVSREDLIGYARMHGLDFVRDPANRDLSYGRSYLRHAVIPGFAERWPSAVQQIGRSAEFLLQARQLIADLAELDIQNCRSTGSGFLSIGFQLGIDKMETLHQHRRINLIRHWIRVHAFPQPGRDALQQFAETVLTRDREFAELRWSDFRMYRYQNNLYLARAAGSALASAQFAWDLSQPLTLEQAGIRLVPKLFEESGLSPDKLAGEVSVRFRTGGERIRLPGRKHSSALKKLFQQHSVPPWERNMLPLIYCDDELAAVAPWLVSDQFKTESGETGIAIHVESLGACPR